MIAFLESADFESAVRIAVSIGGDSDTIACGGGAIAEAFYREIPTEMRE
ncbi:MAG: ADP-ribosylglycohydrolase family protein [Treponema sp.]|nr:ADP-ribosylglycohydrolase family protein [Treponema sp.]